MAFFIGNVLVQNVLNVTFQFKNERNTLHFERKYSRAASIWSSYLLVQRGNVSLYTGYYTGIQGLILEPEAIKILCFTISLSKHFFPELSAPLIIGYYQPLLQSWHSNISQCLTEVSILIFLKHDMCWFKIQ